MVQNFATMVFSVEHSSYRLSVGESFVKTGLFLSVRDLLLRLFNCWFSSVVLCSCEALCELALRKMLY